MPINIGFNSLESVLFCVVLPCDNSYELFNFNLPINLCLRWELCLLYNLQENVLRNTAY